jgi:hypothetical protein
MARAPAVWSRRQTGYYYTTLNGKKVRRSKDRAVADRALDHTREVKLTQWALANEQSWGHNCQVTVRSILPARLNWAIGQWYVR